MVTFKGNSVRLAGKAVEVGNDAPKVELVAGDLSLKSVGGSSGKYQVINVVPSLDTGVCATQTRKFNEKASSLKYRGICSLFGLTFCSKQILFYRGH